MTPTRDDYLQEILDTVSYESDVTGATCTRFIAACRALRILTPISSTQSQGGTTRFGTDFDNGQLAQMENQAQRFMQSLVSRNAGLVLQTAQVPRQFGFNRLRREWYGENPPQSAGVH